jgi:phosphoribosylformimino-5-aminoimidazole carboxamide ribotide isomerase
VGIWINGWKSKGCPSSSPRTVLKSTSTVRIIPVIDLLGGLVVRGIGGRRDEYRPVVSQIAADAQPASVADAFRKLGYHEVYVADLDAIAGHDPAWSQYEALAAAGLQLWVDAGMAIPFSAEGVGGWFREECGLDAPAHSQNRRATPAHSLHRVVVGLESLPGIETLDQILTAVGPDRLVFSLDLKRGAPRTTIHEWRNHSALAIAREVLELGIRHLIMLDLADVGEARGSSTISLCRQVRALDADVELIAGGGVRNRADLDALADAGCIAALVASALHDGQLP